MRASYKTWSSLCLGLALSCWGMAGCDKFAVIPDNSDTTQGTPTTGKPGKAGRGEACGGMSGVSCADDSLFCEYTERAQCGAADAQGLCSLKATACPGIYEPVCGCDGKTYGNTCDAAQNGVSVASQGACGDIPDGGEGAKPGEACGGTGQVNCAEGFYCFYPVSAQCGSPDTMGTCKIEPEACTKELDPVCGCTGATYSNACFAAMVGTSVKHKGKCPETPGKGAACGGPEGLTCQGDLFCNYPVSAKCGEGDTKGRCEQRPDACKEEYDPVCGCDAKTYGNACKAAMSKVSVATKGECPTKPGKPAGPGESCGGKAGTACEANLFCEYPIAAKCSTTTIPGKCQRTGMDCPDEWAPVCGCDGKTYSNACYAGQSGQVSVKHEGECEKKGCGGRLGETCSAKEFCAFERNDICGRADATAFCEPRPEACSREYMPVCGCDEKTYSNECEAQRAGVGVLRDGKCS